MDTRWAAAAVVLACACSTPSSRPVAGGPGTAREPKPESEQVEPLDELITVQLGGVMQAVQLRGRRPDLPLLLFLHGGPGRSEMPYGHVYGDLLEQSFIVVHWDQRGAGRSYREDMDPASMTVDQLVSDTIELARYLKVRFHERPILLLGHSWGSVLGVEVVDRQPELFCAYVGMGQGVDSRLTAAEAINFVTRRAEEAGDEQISEEVRGFAEAPLEPRRFFRLVSLILRYGGVLHKQSDLSALRRWREGSRVPELAPEQVGQDQLFSAQSLWPQIARLDLSAEVTRLDLPVVFMLGRHDHNTPSTVAAEYLEKLEAPQKSIIWFEKSAHFPQLEEPERFARQLTEVVLPRYCSR